LWQALESAITRVATERASFAAVTAGGIDTFALVNQQVIQWVENYYANGTDPGSVGSLNATSRQQFADAFTRWQRGDVPFSQAEGLDGLIELLTPVFGPNRAEMIGITETTRVFVEAQRLAEANNPYTVAFRWLTSADEAVCPICGPMHGQIRRKNEGYAGGVDLPAHVRCRCHEVPETEATLQQPLPPEERFVFNG
jgi:SPP1 gp7 family putative phage head morphogenesis protein